jgi:methylmalonyl-CoA decarboxylase subunit alpha
VVSESSTTEARRETTGERLGPAERLQALCDPGSLEPIRTRIRPQWPGGDGQPGDGVLGGLGRVRGRQIACFAQDVTVRGGSLGVGHAESIVRILELAGRLRVPVVSFIESGGARLQEGGAALGGYGRVFRHNVALSTVVPQISVIAGTAAGGACYSPALTDFVAMTDRAAMFLTGPKVVEEVSGEKIGIAELGGHPVHTRNGVCDLVAPSDRSAAELVRGLLSYLPRSAGAELPLAVAAGPELPDPGALLPPSSRSVYDVRQLLAGIVDAGSVLELAPRWARSVFTGFARLEGRPVGLIANQPRHLGGVLSADSSQKGARFVETCDRFGVPLAVFVDTPGFMPGLGQERAGVIRHGAALVRAFAKATVPRLTVVLRKAYGGAFIAMNSKDLGADMAFAWRGAQIGVMGPQAAAAILHRRELEAATDHASRLSTLSDAYANDHLSADAAAGIGVIDEVIEPRETRTRLIGALEAIAGWRA